MRIVHITPYYAPSVGGAQSYIQEISERLALRGHDVSVLTQRRLTWSEPWDRHCPENVEVKNLVKIKRLQSLDRSFQLLQRLLRLRGSGRFLRLFMSRDHIRMLAYEPLIPRILTEQIASRADVVTVIDWRSAALVYLVYLRRRLTRFSFVGIPLFHTEESFSFSQIYPRILRCCDAVLVNTDHERRFVEERAPRLKEVHVVGAGIEPKLFAKPEGYQIRVRHGIGDAPVVGYIGRMTATKGVGKLIEAMRIVWRSNDQVRLILAGSGPRTGKRLDAEIESALGALCAAEKARLIHIGVFHERDKASLFDALDIFAMPSRAESFGITYLEAWMCGKPVIGSDIGSIQCVIEDGVDGLLVDPNDPGAIARGIMDLLRDSERRRWMGENGYKKAVSRFTWDEVTDRVERIYSGLAAASGQHNQS